MKRNRHARFARTARSWSDGPERELEASGADPGERLARTEAVEQFFAALAQLKPDERTALLLLGLGCSYREICERQGWTHTKIRRNTPARRPSFPP